MDIFVFGTNSSGFHGAGSAGYAMLGVRGNQWRTVKVPGTDKYLSEVPDGTKGLLAVKGIARGLMKGTKGCSYGIETVTKPGAKRSIPLSYIKLQLVALAKIAEKNPRNTYHLSNIGSGYAGYSGREINGIISSIHFPSNVVRCTNFTIDNS